MDVLCNLCVTHFCDLDLIDYIQANSGAEQPPNLDVRAEYGCGMQLRICGDFGVFACIMS
jgi:hypothetical protein